MRMRKGVGEMNTDNRTNGPTDEQIEAACVAYEYTNELIEELRERAVSDSPAHTLMREAADALEAAARVPVQGEPNDDREALIEALVEDAWEGHDEVLDRDHLDLIAGAVIDAGFSRATVPDAAFYGACGVELCETCLPLFDAANREIEGTGSVPDAATAALGRDRLHDAVNALPNHVWDAVNEIADTEGFTDALLAALDGAPEPEAGTKVVIGKQNRGDDGEFWTFTEWKPFELEKAREEFPNSVYEVVTVFGLPVEGEKP